MVLIREICVDDAESYLKLKHKLDAETKFMLLEPGERTTSLEDQKKQIAEMLTNSNQMTFVAENDGLLVGYLSAQGGLYKRNKHNAYIVVGILQEYAGQGIGTSLFDVTEHWAREHAIHRLELTVMKHNEAGLRLYKKRGFEIEGELVHSLFIDDKYIDQYTMAKILS